MEGERIVTSYSGFARRGDTLLWGPWPRWDPKGGRAESLPAWTVLWQQSVSWMDLTDTTATLASL